MAERIRELSGESRIVMEHTGRYYEAVAKVLHEQGLFVSAVNPVLITNYGEYKVHGVKTDSADADKIARFALDRWGLLREYSGMDSIRYDLKTLNRQFQLASKQRTAFSNNLVDLLEQTFPTLRKLFESPVRADGTQKGWTLLKPSGMWTVYASSALTPSPRSILSGVESIAITLVRRKLH